jgi:hypothetical protein
MNIGFSRQLSALSYQPSAVRENVVGRPSWVVGLLTGRRSSDFGLGKNKPRYLDLFKHKIAPAMRPERWFYLMADG